MWCARGQQTEDIEEAGAAIIAGMKMLAEHMDAPMAHALATELLDELLRDLLREEMIRYH